MAINIPGIPFKISPEEAGYANPARAISTAQEQMKNLLQQRLLDLEAQKQKSMLSYAEPMAKEQLKKSIIENIINQSKADVAPQLAKAELSSALEKPNQMRADIGLTNEQSLAQKIRNKYLAQSEQSAINEKNAMSDYYKKGGSSGGVGTKEENYFQYLVSKDNPQLKTPEQIYEASNVLRQGGNHLKDGTPVNSLSPAAEQSLNRLIKGGTTANLITQNIKAIQGDAELKVLDDYTAKALAPYGDTYFNMSGQQIVDSFKKDDASQKRLGEFVGAQGLQYEAANIRNKVAGGEPGITAIHELMHKSGQIIDAKFPKMSAKARNYAIKFIDNGLEKALKARNEVGINPSILTKSISSEIQSTNEPKENYKIQTEDKPSQSSKKITKSWKILDGELI